MDHLVEHWALIGVVRHMSSWLIMENSNGWVVVCWIAASIADIPRLPNLGSKPIWSELVLVWKILQTWSPESSERWWQQAKRRVYKFKRPALHWVRCSVADAQSPTPSHVRNARIFIRISGLDRWKFLAQHMNALEKNLLYKAGKHDMTYIYIGEPLWATKARRMEGWGP